MTKEVRIALPVDLVEQVFNYMYTTRPMSEVFQLVSRLQKEGIKVDLDLPEKAEE